jgi:hypothetical protein
MSTSRMALLAEPDELRGALAPLRRRLLLRLRTPASAAELARELGTARRRSTTGGPVASWRSPSTAPATAC